MSFRNEFEKFVVKLPIIRDVVAIIIGAIRGIMDVINNPGADVTQMKRDLDTTSKPRIVIDRNGQHVEKD